MRTLADSLKVDSLISDLAEAVARRIEPPKGSAPGKAAPDTTAVTPLGNGQPAGWAIVGIRSRGDVLAARLVGKINKQLGRDVFDGRVGAVDITLYRDDLSEIGAQPVVRTTEIPFDIDGLNIVLVDDVLMTGRSVRAALQSLMDLGRPRRVWLAVLVDRGGRELPIAPDHVAWDMTREDHGLTPAGRVEVKLRPGDDQDAILAISALQQRQGGNGHE